MLQLPALDPSPVSATTCFIDHDDSTLVYALPAGLEAATIPGGETDFLLARYRDETASVTGGLLRVRLDWTALPPDQLQQAADNGLTVRPVPLDACRTRLVRRVVGEGTGSAVGPTRPAMPDGALAVVVNVALDKNEVQVVQDLLESETDVLDLRLEADYRGLVPGVPWLVKADRATLVAQLAPLLGPDAVDADHIETAMRSVAESPQSPFQLTPLAADATRPDPADIGTEMARRTLGSLFVAAETAGTTGAAIYRLGPADGPAIVVDLLVPRQASQTLELSWSITALYASIDDPARREELFPTVEPGEPFEEVVIPIVCQAEFDDAYLRSVDLSVRWTGITGTPEFKSFTFTTSGAVERLHAVYPALTSELALASKTRATLAPAGGSGWPVVLDRPYHDQPKPLIAVDGAELGLEFVRVEVEQEVFATAGSIAVTISGADGLAAPSLPATVSLTAAVRAHWLALPGVAADAQLAAQVEASPPVGEPLAPVLLRSGLVVDRRVAVTGADVEVSEPDLLTVRLAETAALRFAYVEITLEPGAGRAQTRTIDPGSSEVFALRRASIFAPFRYRYRLDLVPYDDNHQTEPMVTTDWTEVDGPELLLDPVVPAAATPPGSATGSP
jgi:hypothetical protein